MYACPFDVLLLSVALDALQTSLCFASSVIYLFQDSLPGAAVHSFNDTQVCCFGSLGKLLVVEVDHAIGIDIEHQHLVSTDLEKLLSTED